MYSAAVAESERDGRPLADTALPGAFQKPLRSSKSFWRPDDEGWDTAVFFEKPGSPAERYYSPFRTDPGGKADALFTGSFGEALAFRAAGGAFCGKDGRGALPERIISLK